MAVRRQNIRNLRTLADAIVNNDTQVEISLDTSNTLSIQKYL